MNKFIRKMDGIVALFSLIAALLNKYNGDTLSAIFWLLLGIMAVIPMDKEDRK